MTCHGLAYHERSVSYHSAYSTRKHSPSTSARPWTYSPLHLLFQSTLLPKRPEVCSLIMRMGEGTVNTIALSLGRFTSRSPVQITIMTMCSQTTACQRHHTFESESSRSPYPCQFGLVWFPCIFLRTTFAVVTTSYHKHASVTVCLLDQ